MKERMILQWDDVSASRSLARIATDIAFDFATNTMDTPQGKPGGRGVVYLRTGHVWSAHRTKAGAIVVRCHREVSQWRTS